MRIIRGQYKGKKIYPPKGFNSRPTTDFAKEALFNIIENIFDIEKIKVLDLFSGSGNISFEFLSRGCIDVCSVEINRKYTAHIKKIIEELFPGKAKVLNIDAFKICKTGNLNFDLIFADPPYSITNFEDIPNYIFENKSLKDNVTVIVEHPKEIDFKNFEHFSETRKYGNVNFSIFKKNK